MFSFLKRSYPVERHYFLIPQMAMSAIGFNPEQERTWPVRAWSFFNFFVLTYGCYAEAAYGIKQIPINIALALDALCPVASSILSWLKMMAIWYYRDELKWLIQRIRKLSEQQQSERKLEYKRNLYTLATQLSFLLVVCGIGTSTSYSIRHLLDNMLRLSHGKDWTYETPFKMM